MRRLESSCGHSGTGSTDFGGFMLPSDDPETCRAALTARVLTGLADLANGNCLPDPNDRRRSPPPAVHRTGVATPHRHARLCNAKPTTPCSDPVHQRSPEGPSSRFSGHTSSPSPGRMCGEPGGDMPYTASPTHQTIIAT